MNSLNPDQLETLMATVEESVWENAFSSRLRRGEVHSIQDLRGVKKRLTQTRNHETTSSTECYKKVEQTLWLCHLLRTFMTERLLTQTPPSISPSLSIRETEILKWSAKGKTADDISTILKLKTRTINFHIANAIKKMGATNKTSAVVQAALNGIL
ncbi:LuxR C-terminal-related transcriptional regulator [Pseudomonas sp. RTC3]|uniref:helix-turn-helix transcriptional regulator n=1 Tax=unclassified Pseudomonas TaxID=196821 RepID=UPI002AB47CA4|nr:MULTISPECIES: LuxR C-terminal-related transcriptional regulator [unclassified Pseudomonas]MEB0063665.1 LuxR C-terminal-related transcriptional regulator [Pseudomonas sp. RTC3]MDY7566560.1 LuxR C-terminal-related transcriptional regulator [Pseudomonas sp. 5C2]MEB0005819.1 LuxR C-terminal-related transcriptional regulator [Pseudomonas sp. RTB2]MEB0016836.1 LuxR C-terminal-related transcriptional regulator [Pseudomonas sp. RTB3]MEB0024928.1 LuxR C-terminal-related transcriptional regulator [Ps